MAVNYKTEYYEKIKPDYEAYDTFCPEYWQMHYGDRWLKLIELLPVESVFEPYLLDIGCGMGRAMKHFDALGAKCIGIEPSIYAANIAKLRGMKVLIGHLGEVELNQKFDVVHIEQVLSHCPEPKEFLLKAKELLASDGVLVIEEPNDNSPLQKQLKYGEYWKTADHANYFNFQTLEKLFNEVGLEVVYKTCTYPMELYELAGRRYIGDNEAGKKLHEEKTLMLRNLGAENRRYLLETFARMGWGRDVVMFAKEAI